MTGKITEEQLDRQRRFITERLERLRADLDACRAREAGEADQRLVTEQVLGWAKRAGEGLDGLSDAERREILNLLLDEGSIDGDNNVTLTLAIPTDEFVSIGTPVSACEHHFFLLKNAGIDVINRLDTYHIQSLGLDPDRTLPSLALMRSDNASKYSEQAD